MRTPGHYRTLVLQFTHPVNHVHPVFGFGHHPSTETVLALAAGTDCATKNGPHPGSGSLLRRSGRQIDLEEAALDGQSHQVHEIFQGKFRREIIRRAGLFEHLGHRARTG